MSNETNDLITDLAIEYITNENNGVVQDSLLFWNLIEELENDNENIIENEENEIDESENESESESESESEIDSDDEIDEIEYIKRNTFKLHENFKTLLKNTIDKNENCVICLEIFGESDLCVTKCAHFYHLKCFEKVKGNQCPLCKEKLSWTTF